MRSWVGRIVLVGLWLQQCPRLFRHSGPVTRRPMSRGWLMANPI